MHYLTSKEFLIGLAVGFWLLPWLVSMLTARMAK